MHYRLYFQDANGHFMCTEEVEATADEDAMEAARDQRHVHCIEVWKGPVIVGTVKPAQDTIP